VSPETHKVLLENERVRVLGVRVKPGEKIGMHSHPANVVYFLTDGTIRFTYPDGKIEERQIKATTHAAENVGAAEFQEVQIEFKGTGNKPARVRERHRKACSYSTGGRQAPR